MFIMWDNHKWSMGPGRIRFAHRHFDLGVARETNATQEAWMEFICSEWFLLGVSLGDQITAQIWTLQGACEKSSRWISVEFQDDYLTIWCSRFTISVDCRCLKKYRSENIVGGLVLMFIYDLFLLHALHTSLILSNCTPYREFCV